MLYIFGYTAQHYLNFLQTSGEVRPFPDSMLLFLFVAASVVCIYFVFMATFCLVSFFLFGFFLFVMGEHTEHSHHCLHTGPDWLSKPLLLPGTRLEKP